MVWLSPMAILPRAALLLALAVALAPAVAAEEAGESAPPSSDGAGEPDPVEEIEECVCNETGNQTGNQTEEPTEPECTLPSCVTDPEERAMCSPGGIDLSGDEPTTTVQIDPDGCYRAAVKKALEGAPPIVKNAVCALLSRLP